ncbi:hypothetical protein, partial [Shewanella algae]|uniref:hypothetical protein n=1 Tax=Shewanella algae TaxID=38313 RepID=UPI003D7C5681
GATYTAGDAVIEGGVLKTDLSISWPRHGILSFSKAPFKPRQGANNLPRIMGVFILMAKNYGCLHFDERNLPRIMGVFILSSSFCLRVLKSTTGA